MNDLQEKKEELIISGKDEAFLDDIEEEITALSEDVKYSSELRLKKCLPMHVTRFFLVKNRELSLRRHRMI